MYTRRWCLILKRTQAFVSKRPVWPQASYLTSLSLLSVICKFGNNNSYSAGLFWGTKWESVASAQSGTWHFQSSLATFSFLVCASRSLLSHCKASATTSVLMASYSLHTEICIISLDWQSWDGWLFPYVQGPYCLPRQPRKRLFLNHSD